MKTHTLLRIALMGIGAALVPVNGDAFAQSSIVNQSFEAIAASGDSGYGPIPGWTPDSLIGTGLGINEGGGPFADNGAIPHGRRVAFLQDNGILSQKISGFTPGETYWLVFRENARGLCCGERVAILKALVGKTTVVPEHEVVIVGQANPYRLVVSESFIAAETEMTLSFAKGGYGDSAVLLDDVRILRRESLRLPTGLPSEKLIVLRVENIPGRQVIRDSTVTLTPDTLWEALISNASSAGRE